MTPAVRSRLRFTPVPPTGAALDGEPGVTVVVLDTAWTPVRAGPADRGAGVVLLRDVVERIMRERDLIAVAAESLNDWAETSGIADLMVHEGVSYWYGQRVNTWMWLLDRVLWLAVVDLLLVEHPGTDILELETGADEALVAAAGLVAERDGLVAEDGTATGSDTAGTGHAASTPTGKGSSLASPAAASAVSAGGGPGRRRGIIGRILRRLRPTRREKDQRLVMTRAAELAAEPGGRLLVVQAHARQRIETPSGLRHMNAYLGPVADRLRGSALDPFEVDIRSSLADRGTRERLTGPGGGRSLPSDVLGMIRPAVDIAPGKATAEELAQRVAALRTPVVVSGVDLGPALAARVATRIRSGHARKIRDTARIRGLLRRLHPAGILLADEYHRQDWLAAAKAEGVPVAAVQHGVIYRWHNGYMHRTRPAALRVPGRTYVFGSWERDVLVGTSIYEPGEVVVSGSPRLVHTPDGRPDAAVLREELGVADGDRLVVLSGTWGPMYRRFHYPIALANLFSRPVERVHLVVKLHPAEQDEGPYRAIVEGLARAGGFTAPPITVVRDVDLYRLLAVADAHLGIHSTVLTEAVVTGTPNLLATGLVAADLLGYVEAGVAVPVETTDDLIAALEVPRTEIMDPVRREAFLRAHFEPGDAGARIADDLLAWLA